MPNSFILMGNVDSKEMEKEKFSAAEEILKNINLTVQQRIRGVYRIKKGFLPWFLTGL
jgi:hypothetical protein